MSKRIINVTYDDRGRRKWDTSKLENIKLP